MSIKLLTFLMFQTCLFFLVSIQFMIIPFQPETSSYKEIRFFSLFLFALSAEFQSTCAMPALRCFVQSETTTDADTRSPKYNNRFSRSVYIIGCAIVRRCHISLCAFDYVYFFSCGKEMAPVSIRASQPNRRNSEEKKRRLSWQTNFRRRGKNVSQQHFFLHHVC